MADKFNALTVWEAVFLGIGLTSFVYSSMAIAMHVQLRKGVSDNDPSTKLFTTFILSLIIGFFIMSGMIYLMFKK